MPLSDAQTASPLTLSVPAGSATVRAGPAELDSADHRAVSIDPAGPARAIETIKREELVGYEAPRGVGGEAFRAGRACCKQDKNYRREPSKVEPILPSVHDTPPVPASLVGRPANWFKCPTALLVD